MSPKPLASKTFLDDQSRELDSAQGSFICDVCGSRDGCTREEAASGNHLCEDCWEESQRTRAAELNEERTAKNCSWGMEEESTDDDRYGMDEEDEEMGGSDDEYEVEEPDEEEEEDSLVDSMCPDFAHRSVMALELGRAAQDQEELRLNKELLDAFYNTEVNRDLLTQLYTKKRSAKTGDDDEEEGGDDDDDEKEAQSISFSTQGLVRFFDSAASMADTHIRSFPLEIKAFDGQSGHQANYIGSAMEEEEEEEPMLDADYEEGEEDVKADEDGSESTAESDGEAADDDDDEDWDTSSLAEYTTDELSHIRDLMSTPRGSLS
ncbi:hypothetical protein FOZ61_002171 [Perkinsus olseni]|uniref:Uncharacterized protein n=1 Tax=Perkinsus olseni TaxID=32597 RepID=A0A7J6LU06_PEROL|nr:hypothetical protein FOZ61_002171 [Perkinsus olseni]KAF4670617.1 hypothetical protein FOL46_000711 [Perkinsus olseni]